MAQNTAAVPGPELTSNASTGTLTMTRFTAGSICIRYEATLDAARAPLDSLWYVVLDSVYTEWDPLSRKRRILENLKSAAAFPATQSCSTPGLPRAVASPAGSGSWRQAGEGTMEELHHTTPSDADWSTRRVCYVRYHVRNQDPKTKTGTATEATDSPAGIQILASVTHTLRQVQVPIHDSDNKPIASACGRTKTVTVYELQEFYTGPGAHRALRECYGSESEDHGPSHGIRWQSGLPAGSTDKINVTADVDEDWKTAVKTAVKDMGDGIMRRALLVSVQPESESAVTPTGAVPI